MPRFRFDKPTGVEGRVYQDGDIVDLKDIPEGCHQSLRQLGVGELLPDEPQEQTEQATEGEQSPDPEKPPARTKGK